MDDLEQYCKRRSILLEKKWWSHDQDDCINLKRGRRKWGDIGYSSCFYVLAWVPQRLRDARLRTAIPKIRSWQIVFWRNSLRLTATEEMMNWWQSFKTILSFLPTKLFCTMLWKNIITAYRNTSPMSASINCLPSERCGGLTRISSVRETSGQFPHWIFRILPRLIPTASMQS